MKKVVSLLLALVMCLSLCACGGGNDAGSHAETTIPEETVISKDEMLKQAVAIDIDSFLKECSANIAKVKLDYVGKSCLFEAEVFEIQEDYIIVRSKYLEAKIYLPIEEIVELQTNQYVELVGILDKIDYDTYEGAFADFCVAYVSNDTFVRTGIYRAFSTTDGTHPQVPCLECVDNSGVVYYIELELNDDQRNTLTNGAEITIEGKLFDNYWDTTPNHANLKMIDFVVK